jgi:hypothetical protein
MRKIHEKAAETTAIEAVFLSMKMQERMTFAQLSEKVGFKVSSSLGAYHSARKSAERDHGVYIAAEPGIGFFRGTAEDMADSLKAIAKHVRKQAKKSINRADLAISHNLNADKHQQVMELRNRASIIYSTSAAPLPMSNRSRRPDVPVAEKASPFDALAGVR